MKRLVIALALCAPSAAFGQSPPPGRTEVPTLAPSYLGTLANAPIPPEYHIQNEGGSDGAGLCVVSSELADGLYQGIPGLELGKGSLFWQTAKANPGGYFPEKLIDLAEKTLPGVGYASFLDRDPLVLDRLSKMGYPIGLTMDTGELYQWQKISHMVSNVHFDWQRDLACHVDNNKPGTFVWTSAREALDRAIDDSMGEYWAFVWTQLPWTPTSDAEEDLLLGAAVVVVALVVVRRKVL